MLEIVSIVSVICLTIICYFQHKDLKHLIDILSTRNPDSVIFNEDSERKETRSNPYKKRVASEKKFELKE